MIQSNIIQSLCDLVDDKIIIENEEYKKQRERADKLYDLFEEYMKIDKKLFQVFFNYNIEDVACEVITNEIYFKEGFLRGARLMLEICGFEREEK